MSDKPKRKNKPGAGRPTKYTPALLEAARYYADNWQEINPVIPSIVGLALHCDITKKCVYDWLKDDDKHEFCDIIARVSARQEQELLANGLNRTFDSQLARLLLGKHGHIEKKEIDMNLKEVPQIIDDIEETKPEPSQEAE